MCSINQNSQNWRTFTTNIVNVVNVLHMEGGKCDICLFDFKYAHFKFHIWCIWYWLQLITDNIWKPNTNIFISRILLKAWTAGWAEGRSLHIPGLNNLVWNEEWFREHFLIDFDRLKQWRQWGCCSARQLVELKTSLREVSGCIITEKAPTRAFSWLKAATTAFTFKILLKALC